MSKINKTSLATARFRSKVEHTFSGVLFIASAVVYVGGTLAMFFTNTSAVI